MKSKAYKAYVFANASDYDVDDLSETVTFAESPGKAKQDFSMENGIHYKDIRVQRLPWADKYGDVDKIPVKEWFDHGYHFTCNICGKTIEDIADFWFNDDGNCCKKCFDEWEEENDS